MEYLKRGLTREQLQAILDRLSEPPSALIRRDRNFEALGLNPADDADYNDREPVIELLIKHPELMQRPVVIQGERAIIARPPERLLELI